MAYPNSLDSFTTKVDGVDSVQAAHVNALQAALVAIETELGTLPKGGYADVTARLNSLQDAIDAISLTGWIPAGITWTYASATSFTIAGDYSAILTKGMKFKLTANSVVLQGYILSATYSSPNTTVTVVGDALTNHTFTDNYYSTAANPAGFTHWFSVVTPVFDTTTIDNGSGGQPVITETLACISNGSVKLKMRGSATLGEVVKVGAGIFVSFTIPTTLPDIADALFSTIGSSFFSAVNLVGIARVSATNRTIQLYSSASIADNANIQVLGSTLEYRF